MFLNIEYIDAIENAFDSIEDKVNFCGDVIEMIFDSKEYNFSKEGEDLFMKQIMHKLQNKCNSGLNNEDIIIRN